MNVNHNFDGTMHRMLWQRLVNRLRDHKQSGAEPVMTDREWQVVARVLDANLNLLKKSLAKELTSVYTRVLGEVQW